MSLCLSGEGISTQLQEYMSRMFNDTSEEMNGDVCETLSESFVGLSIASEIVKKMGGKIAVDSDLGHGTEFNVSGSNSSPCIEAIINCRRVVFILAGLPLHTDRVTVKNFHVVSCVVSNISFHC